MTDLAIIQANAQTPGQPLFTATRGQTITLTDTTGGPAPDSWSWEILVGPAPLAVMPTLATPALISTTFVTDPTYDGSYMVQLTRVEAGGLTTKVGHLVIGVKDDDGYLLPAAGADKTHHRVGATTPLQDASEAYAWMGGAPGSTNFMVDAILRLAKSIPRSIIVPAAATFILSQAQLGGVGAHAGTPMRFAAQQGQNVSGGTNNNGADLQLAAGLQGTGGSSGTPGAVSVWQGGNELLRMGSYPGAATVAYFTQGAATIAMAFTAGAGGLIFQAPSGVCTFDTPTFILRDAIATPAVTFALNSAGTTSQTFAAGVSASIVQAQLGGTGAAAGTAMHVRAQQGQQQSGGNANTDGAPLGLHGGKAGTGGAGAAGSSGAVWMYSGDEHMLTFGKYPGAPSYAGFTTGSSATSGMIFNADSSGGLIQFIGGLIAFVGPVNFEDPNNGAPVFILSDDSAGIGTLSIGGTCTGVLLTQVQAIGAGSTAGKRTTIQAQKGQNPGGIGGFLRLASGEEGNGATANPGTIEFYCGTHHALDLFIDAGAPAALLMTAATPELAIQATDNMSFSSSGASAEIDVATGSSGLIVLNTATVVFSQSGTGTALTWTLASGGQTILSASNGMDFRSTSTSRFTFNATGIAFYGGTPVAQASRATNAPLTAASGSASSTINDVGGAFSQTTLNNNFKSIVTTLNSLELAIHNLRLTA